MTIYDAGPLAAGPLCGLLILGSLAKWVGCGMFWPAFAEHHKLKDKAPEPRDKGL